MFSAAAASVPPTDSRRAYGAGVIAGVLTLAVGWIVLAQLGWTGIAGAATGAALEAGDCLELSGDEPVVPREIDCSEPHDGEVAGIATHPDSGRPFPGEAVTAVWFEQGCRSVTTDYLGADHLTTTLDARVLMPTESDWNDGVHHAACYVTIGDGAQPLTDSVQGRAEDFSRGDVVPISRLLPGDCFDPAGSVDPFGLRSSDMVELTDCEGSFSGLFFGRADLPFPDEAPIPSDRELSDSSTTGLLGCLPKLLRGQLGRRLHLPFLAALPVELEPR